MKRLMRWIGIALGSLVALAVVAYGVLYALSERVLRRTYELPAAVVLAVPGDAASIAEGQRLTAVHGCFGCHGDRLQGTVMYNEPIIARIVAPNLTAAARKYSDAELATAIRHGLRPGGRSMVVMPAEAFVDMSDADLVQIIAYVRSLAETPGPGPDVSLGPVGRLGFVTGQFKLAAQLIADSAPLPAANDEQSKLGRYLAKTICAQCHGANLTGASNPDFSAPNLTIVSAYTPEAFATLMKEGVALGSRKLGVMAAAARQDLSHLTDAEIAALYSYLHTAVFAGP